MNTNTTPAQKLKALLFALKSHAQLRRSVRAQNGKWRRYLRELMQNGWVKPPPGLRSDLRAWQQSGGSRSSAAQPMAWAESILF